MCCAMLSFVGFVSYTLVLSTTLGAVRPLALGRADDGGRVLCTRAAAVDEDLLRRILIPSESYVDEDFDNEDPASDRALADFEEVENDEPFDESEVLKDVGEDRTDLEWKKIGRYIKRQLKVPRRYLKKIVRTLSKVTKLRSLDSDEGMISIVSPDDAGILSGGNGAFERGDLLFVEEPPSVRYLAVIAAPGEQFFK